MRESGTAGSSGQLVEAGVRGAASSPRRDQQARDEPLSCSVERVGAPGNAPFASACRGRVEALTKAVAGVLTTFGVGEAGCGQGSVRELAATTRDLTVVVDSEGGLGAAVVFGFDSGVARAVAGKVLAFMFEGAEALPAGEEDESVRRALGEVVSFALLGTLNALGLPPEFPAPRFVQGRGVGLLREPRAVRSFAITTESGEFEVGFAPGAALSRDAGPRGEAAPGTGRDAAEP